MVDVNLMAVFVQRSMLWYTPYKTGNLARSVGDVGTMSSAIGEAAGFQIFNANQSAPYGGILNDFPVINYTVTNSRTGQTYTGSYPNKHYQWIDKGLDSIANDFAAAFGLRRII